MNYYNSKQTSGREHASAELLQVRNLNNFVKSALLQFASGYMIQTALTHKITIPFCILEVSCGAMGDLKKWYSSFPAGFLDHIDGFDCSEQCIQRAQERILPTQKVRLTVSDASKPWPTQGVYWAVSCQMALHYFVFNESTARDYFQKCFDALISGGLVVMTLPDSDTFAERWVAKTLGNDQRSNKELYQINHVMGANDLTPTHQYWGIEYEFTLPGCVEGCLEHFIPWRELETIAQSKGFDLVVRDNFETFARSQWNITSLSSPALLRTIYSLPHECNPKVKQVSSFYSVMIFQKKM